MRVGRSVLLSNLLLLALVASCSSGRDENALAATDLGRFQGPPGSVLLDKSYSPGYTGESSGLTYCATYTRVFGTNDVDGFEHAVFETVRGAHWSAAQSEAPAPVDGISDLFRGDSEVAQLSFWSKQQSNDRHIYQRWSGPDVLAHVNVDWSVYRFAAVLEILDGTLDRCGHQTHSGMTRVAGHVTDAESGLPVAGVSVRLYQQYPNGRSDTFVVASTDNQGLYTFDSYGYPIRGVSFDGGPDYLVTWWRDATSPETATALTIGGSNVAAVARNVVHTGIDAKLQRAGAPQGSSGFPDSVNFAQRSELGRATQFVVLGGCPQSTSRADFITGCSTSSLTGPAWEARSNSGAPVFANVLDADLPALHAQPLTPDSLVILFLFPDHYVAFDYELGRNLLTSSLSIEKVAVQPPSTFAQGLASFIVANRQTIPRPSSRP